MMIVRVYHGPEFVHVQATVYEQAPGRPRTSGVTIGTYSLPRREDLPLVEQYCRAVASASALFESESRDHRGAELLKRK